MKFGVTISKWGADDAAVFEGGVHELDLTPELAPVFAGAAAAGSIEILETTPAEDELLAGHVQSQVDGEAAYEAAQADGSWQEGNVEQFNLDVAAGLREETL